MIVIEKFNNKYSNIFKENSQLLQERKLNPPAVIKYANANKNFVLLAIENKVPIGFIIGYSNENRNYVLTIFVKEINRKQKVGSLLVNSLIQQKKCLWTVRLRSIDYPLIGFFEKCHFSKITELNLYMKENVEFPIKKSNTINFKGNFIISIANQRHIPQLMNVEKNCFDVFWLRSKQEWKSILDDDRVIVFIIEIELDHNKGTVIGFSHNSISNSNGSREGQYIRIAVNPEYRKAGIATKLTEKAFEFFQRNNVKKVYLSTVKENQQLNTMYKKWGFELFDSDMIMGRNET